MNNPIYSKDQYLYCLDAIKRLKTERDGNLSDEECKAVLGYTQAELDIAWTECQILTEQVIQSIRDAQRTRAARFMHVVRRAPVLTRTRSRSVRSHSRHVSRSFITAGVDSGGGGDDGGDGQSDSDCNRIAADRKARGSFGVAAVLDVQGQFDRINSIASRKRAWLAPLGIPAGLWGCGRFFVPFWRWAA